MSEFDDRPATPADLSYADLAGEQSPTAESAEPLGFSGPEAAAEVDAEPTSEPRVDGPGANFGDVDPSVAEYGARPSDEDDSSAGGVSEDDAFFGASPSAGGGPDSVTDASTVDYSTNGNAPVEGDSASPSAADDLENGNSEMMFDNAGSADTESNMTSGGQQAVGIGEFDTAVDEEFNAFRDEAAEPGDDEFTTTGGGVADVELNDSTGDVLELADEPDEFTAGQSDLDDESARDVTAGEMAEPEIAGVEHSGEGEFGELTEVESAAARPVDVALDDGLESPPDDEEAELAEVDSDLEVGVAAAEGALVAGVALPDDSDVVDFGPVDAERDDALVGDSAGDDGLAIEGDEAPVDESAAVGDALVGESAGDDGLADPSGGVDDGPSEAVADEIPDDLDPVAAQVLALRGRLAELDELPLEQHPAYYDDLHSELTNALAQIDRAQNS